MTIKSKWLSFIVQFNKETMRVDAELSLAAKMLATTENHQVAIQLHRPHARMKLEPAKAGRR